MHLASGSRMSAAVLTVSLAFLLTGCVAGSRAGGPMGTAAPGPLPTVSCNPPGGLAGTVVAVRLSDMGMMHMMGGDAPLGAHMTLTASPVTVKAGVVTFIASNAGWRTHELIILPLDGATDGQRSAGGDGKVDESQVLGEASRPCAADAGTGLTAGSAGWTTVTLAAGRYELVCNLANHYADGMHQQLVVT